jgi:GNAT superfamily N-acetyltransferase
MSDSNVSVRGARPEDAEALARLSAQLGYPSVPADMPARLERVERDGTARVFVADSDGETVGLATGHIRHMINHAAPIGQLSLLVVDETRRSRGVGRLLVEAVEHWARERGCHRIVVTTALRRTDAHAFYERIGYQHTGRRYAKDFD